MILTISNRTTSPLGLPAPYNIIKGQETRNFTTHVKDLEGARIALINLSDLGLISFSATNEGTSAAELDTQFTTTYDTGTSLVASVGGTLPIVSSGGVNPLISIDAATALAAGSMSAANFSALAALVLGIPASTIQVITSGTTGTIQPTDRAVYVATGSGNFNLTMAPIAVGHEVEIIKTSLDTNSITLVRTGSETINTTAGNLVLPGSTGTVGFMAWSLRDYTTTQRSVT